MYNDIYYQGYHDALESYVFESSGSGSIIQKIIDIGKSIIDKITTFISKTIPDFLKKVFKINPKFKKKCKNILKKANILKGIKEGVRDIISSFKKNVSGVEVIFSEEDKKKSKIVLDFTKDASELMDNCRDEMKRIMTDTKFNGKGKTKINVYDDGEDVVFTPDDVNNNDIFKYAPDNVRNKAINTINNQYRFAKNKMYKLEHRLDPIEDADIEEEVPFE